MSSYSQSNTYKRVKPRVEMRSQRKNTCRPTACPSCGGTDCIERPRFFSGQLLTDADLEAAQRYVIEKNRLHNRHLVGTGVVCGLAVRCDPCDGVIDIEPGYAIDCCGNDVVMCAETSFDVMQYINSCLTQEDPGCAGKIRRRPATPCDNQPQEYCLVITYQEEQTRPVTVLGRGEACNSGRCEPSRTRETFRLDLVESSGHERYKPGGMIGKVLACAQEIVPRIKTFSERLAEAEKLSQDLPAYHAAVFAVYCDLAGFVEALYADGPAVRCSLDTELKAEIDRFPDLPANQEENLAAYRRAIFTALARMYARVIQYLIDCLCDAMLVPCTECSEDDHGVLLACLKVCDGKVTDICNTVRHQVASGPAMHYWLEPLYGLLHTLLVQLCCEFDPAALVSLVDPRRANSDVRSFKVAYDRSQSTFGMARDSLGNLGELLKKVNLGGAFFNPNVVTTADMYGKNAEAVRTQLNQQNISVVDRQAATHAEAYSTANLGRMAFNVPQGSQVEMIIDPDGKVAGLRFLK